MLLGSAQTPNLSNPRSGSEAMYVLLDFTGGTTLNLDLSAEALVGRLPYIQTVWVDNKDNTAPIDITMFGGPRPQTIRCPAFRQGWFPLSEPIDSARFTATSAGGVKVDVQFCSFWMAPATWGPVDGTVVVPPLTNKALNALNFGAPGNAQLVAGVGGQSVKLYRGMFSVDSPAVLRWTDGPGGTVLFAAQLTAGGSVNFQASGIPWFNTGAGNDLTLNSDSAVNVYGGFGYVQS